jgi:hypothetical protein
MQKNTKYIIRFTKIKEGKDTDELNDDEMNLLYKFNLLNFKI